jgi:hypothetical protein
VVTAKPIDAVLGLDLDDQGAQHIDAEAAAALAVFGIFRHRRGDMIVDPVAVALVVIVGAAAPVVLHDEGADVFDLRQATHPRTPLSRSIIVPIFRDDTGVSPRVASN